MKVNHLNVLLVEIMMAVLFFALSAVVILEVFAAANTGSMEAGILGDVLSEAKSLSERIYAAEDAEALLQAEGYAFEQGAWRIDAGDYCLLVEIETEQTGSGKMRVAEVTAERNGEALLTLPCSRYIAGEVAE